MGHGTQRTNGVAGGWGWYQRSPVKPAEEITLNSISAELIKARMKFPGNRHLLAALTKEVGELAQKLLQGATRIQIEREAIQVACVAVRIIEEGDASFDWLSEEEKQK